MRHHLLRFLGGFKGLLFGLTVIVGILLYLYTQKLVVELRDETRTLVTFYGQMYSQVADAESFTGDLSLVFEAITKANIPLIQTDQNKVPITWKGVSVSPEDHSEEAMDKVSKMVMRLDQEIHPVVIRYQDQILGYLYYGDSRLIEQLQWAPYVQIGIIALFLFLGLMGSAQIKKSEERHIWVGMAKETAHQLGTPISSLMGWLEIMKTGSMSAEDISSEMNRDLKRLQQVTQRFSQIGSKPDVKNIQLSEVLSEVCDYMRRRSPQTGKRVEITEHYETVPNVDVNVGLLQWAIENIMKNSLDAMDKDEGRIHLKCCPCSNSHSLCIEIQDNGRGIEEKNKKRIFKPGFSTKARGWGLGLSLSRRIIEEYHHGKIFVKESKPGEGTTMRIEL